MIAWLTTVWGKRLLMVLALAGLLAGARWYFIAEGERNGRAAAAQDAKIEIEAERNQNRAAVTKALSDSAAEMEAAQKRFDSAQTLLVRQQQTIQQLIGQRQQQAAVVAQISDTALHAFNTKTIGLRKADDETAGYYPGEERAIATCLTDRPLCEEQSKATADSLRTTQEQIKSLQEQMQSFETRDAAVLNYANSVEKDYVRLYNSMPRKRNWFLTIITFGLKGKAKPLDVPDPLTIEKRRRLLEVQ